MALLQNIFTKKNRINSLKIEDLRISEIQLNKKISELQREMQILEKRINNQRS